MSATASIQKTFTVGKFTVEVSMPPLRHGESSMAIAEWDPYQPLANELTHAETQEYLRQLQQFVIESNTEYLASLGGKQE
jgi:hypothetical protein